MAPVIQSRTSTYLSSSCPRTRSALSWLAKTPDLISRTRRLQDHGLLYGRVMSRSSGIWTMSRNIHKPAQRVKLLRLSSDRSSLYSLNQGIEIGGLLNRSNGAGFVPCRFPDYYVG
jgi:hypothetical protein